MYPKALKAAVSTSTTLNPHLIGIKGLNEQGQNFHYGYKQHDALMISITWRWHAN